MHSTRKKWSVIGALLLALAAGVLIAVPACETVKGAGKDVQNVGQAGSDVIDHAAGKNKSK